MFWNSSFHNCHLHHTVLQQNAEQLIQIVQRNGIFKTSVLCFALKVHKTIKHNQLFLHCWLTFRSLSETFMRDDEVIITQWHDTHITVIFHDCSQTSYADNAVCSGITGHTLPVKPVVKVVLWSRGGGSPDEARLEQTPYPFQPH